MNYPYGSDSEQVSSHAKNKGAKLRLTTKVKIAQIGISLLMELPRLDGNDFPSKTNKILRVSKGNG